MLARAQVAGDALALLTRGWLLAQQGIWVPFGNPLATSTGGFIPGGLTALVVGVPLMAWMDHRAPVVPILASHVLAYLLLDRVVGSAWGGRGGRGERAAPARIVLAVVYWLGPWRLYQSAWLDNSNYVFLTGAIHLWTCYRQRERAGFWDSTLLVGAVGLTLQLHMDAMLLVFATGLLWLRGHFKPHWGGVLAGTAITFGSLVPYFAQLARHPEILPGGSGDPLGTSLLFVWPPLKGVLYWVRYASLSVSGGFVDFDFGPAFGARVDRVLTPALRVLAVLAAGTAFFALAANVRAFRRHLAWSRSRPSGRTSGRIWLRGYALWMLAAGVVANSLSPTTVMWWHNLIAFHAAVLPVVLWGGALLRTRHAPRVRRAIAAYAGLSVVLLLGMAFGADQYRHGGREPQRWVLHRSDHVVRDLRLTEYGIVIDSEGGWWPINNELLYEEYVRPFLLPPPGAK